MGLQRVPRQAFNRGKISRLGLGRTDVERAELSAETQTNWMPRVLGSMMLRPGWKYLGSTLSDTQAFLVPFIKSTDDTAFVEFTNQSIRVWEDDAVVTRNAVSTTTRGGDFSADVTNFNKQTDLAALPAIGNEVAFSADGAILAIAHNNGSSRTVTCYSVSGTTITALTNPTGGSTTANGLSVGFSPGGDILAVGNDSANGWDAWSISGTGASAVFTILTTPALSPGDNVNDMAFSPNGQFLALAHSVSPFVTIYEITGTGASATFTALSAPATLPAGIGNGVGWSQDGRFLAVAHTTTPFVTIYEVNGTTFTKLSNPANLPGGQGNSAQFSRDGKYLVVAFGAASPFMIVYSISDTTFTKMADPATPPTGGTFDASFSSDSQFIAIGHDVSPFLSIYRLTSGAWVKQSNPSTLPDDDCQGVAFSPNNNLLFTTGPTSPFHTFYQAYQWLDMDGSGASSTYSGLSVGDFSSAIDHTTLVVDAPSVAAGASGLTLRQTIDGDTLTREGDRVKVSFKAYTGTFQVDKAYIGKRASSGDLYDFASAPVQLTFNGGSAGFTISSSATITSDIATFEFDSDDDIIIAFHIANSTNDSFASHNAASPTVNLRGYYKQGADDTATVNATGYTALTGHNLNAVYKVEVANSTENGGAGLLLVGTNYNDARRVQAVSVSNTDKTVEHGITIVIAQGTLDFHVGTTFGGDDLVEKRTLGKGTYSFAFTPNSNLFFIEIHSNTEYTTILSSIQIDGSGNLTLPVAHETADLTNIRHAQSGDVIYIACIGVKQQKILRFGSKSWGVADYLPEDGPFRNENTDFTTLTPSGLTGDITITSSKDYFKSTQVDGLIRITSVGQTVESALNGANQFTSHIKVTNTGTARDITITRAGTWVATVTLQRSISEPGTWVDVATFTTNGTATYNDGLDNQTIYYRIGIKTGNYTSGTATLTLTYASGGIDGVARITEYTDQKTVSAIVLSPMGGTGAFETWAEGIWSDRRGWPSSVALYEGRLAWAGMDRIILSESDGYENFNDLVEGDAGPIIRNIGEGPVDDIHWLLPLQRLIAGAEGSEFSIRSNSFDEPLTPDNYNMKSASTQGSAAVGAVRIDSNGAFVERSGTRLYQLVYNFDTYDYSSSDLTRLVPDMCEAGIKKIVLQRHPDTRIHCVLDDGTVAMVIFEPDEDVICWIDITTDGLIEDAVILPQEQLEDAVYYVVNRTINGETKRYVEKWALESECVGGTLNKQADSYLQFSQAASSTVSGLSHLEGESVVVWADGKCLRTSAGAIATFTVTSGAITLTNNGSSYSATTGIVGLPYTAEYVSSKLAYAAEGGTALSARKILHSVGIIAADLHHKGLDYGDSLSFLRPLAQVYRNKDVTVDTVHTSFDDDLIPINKSWSPDTRLTLKASAPRPATVLAITMAIETNG